ncbi:MAG TPA: serine/threonine-protein kinase [Acidimicrobiales bacterium]|nr:serine/threonine-protein kinase [Acidimicrobiales bacterium]
MTYTVVGLLGRGGMAVVELAVDDLGRHVARKRVALGGSAREIEMARQRIRREAEILSTLRHPGIVPLLAVEDDGADVVLVMPRMVDSLADRVGTMGPLPPATVIAIGRVLLAALAQAHRQGVVHRDLKPANVLFDEFGRPAIADFGVAVARQFTAGLTSSGTVVGTPGFMAPEQARDAKATPASDVFSLAATLAYALTGRGPFGDGDPLSLIARAARGQVAPLPRSLPADLRWWLTAMLDPRPERRPSAAAVAGGPTGTKVNTVVVRRYRSPPRSRRWRTLLAAGLAAVAVAVTAAIATSGPRGQTSSTRGRVAAGGPNAAAAPACTPLTYQPCGGPPAPFTDGSSCIPGHADYDGVVSNGCEAASTYVAGTVLDPNKTLLANLVPADSTDTIRTYVKDSLWDFCRGEFRAVLTAPPGVAFRLDIAQGERILASAVSRDGRPAVARAHEPSCFSDNSGWLTLRVSAVEGKTAINFRLTRGGDW